MTASGAESYIPKTEEFVRWPVIWTIIISKSFCPLSVSSHTRFVCVYLLYLPFLAADSVCLKVNSSIDLMMWIWGLKTERKKNPSGSSKNKGFFVKKSIGVWCELQKWYQRLHQSFQWKKKISPFHLQHLIMSSQIKLTQNISSYLRVAAVLFHKRVCTYMPCLYIFSLYYEYQVLHFLNDLAKPCILFH